MITASADEFPDDPPVDSTAVLTISEEDQLASTTLPPASRLRLVPGNEEAPIISLVADATLVAGRSSTEADFISQFRPRSNINDGRSRRIGRTQAKLQWRHDRLRIYEPDVVNPSLILETPIRLRAALALPTTVVLAGEYALRVRSVASHYTSKREIKGWPTEDDTPLKGAMVLQSAQSGVLASESALLVSDISVYLTAAGRPKLLVSSADKPVMRFHRLGGHFWMEVIQPDHVLTTANTPDQLQHHENLRLLKHGMNIKLGNHAYTVQHYELTAAQWSLNDQTATQQ